MKRFALAISAVVLLRVVISLCDWVPAGAAETHGLELRVYRDEPYERSRLDPSYFECLGFAFGNGWIAGMTAGRGQFLHAYWLLVIPYWFFGGLVMALAASVIIRRISGDLGSSGVAGAMARAEGGPADRPLRLMEGDGGGA